MVVPLADHRPYAGPLKAVILDWAGTTVDYGSFAPVVVFVKLFARRGVTVSVAEARAPMGLEKKDHIRAITQLPAVAGRWAARYGGPPTEADIEALFQESVALQRETVVAYADLIPGTTAAVNPSAAIQRQHERRRLDRGNIRQLAVPG